MLALLQKRQRLVKVHEAKNNASVAHLTRVQQYFALKLLHQYNVAEKKSAPMRDLSADEAKQLERICDLLLQCKNEQPVQTESLRSALTKAQYSAFKAQTRAPTTSADMFGTQSRPQELTRYLAMLKTADLTNARADRAAASKIPKRIGNLSAAEHWRNQSESEYEHALEYLDEMLGAADSETAYEMRAWLDREFELSEQSSISCDDGGVPRVIGSRSKHCRVAVQTKKSAKQEKWTSCAQDALQQAALQFIYAPAVATDAQKQKLTAMLGKLKR